MIYATQQAARSSLMEFSAAMRAQHVVIQATRNGEPVGWMRQLQPAGTRRQKARGR